MSGACNEVDDGEVVGDGAELVRRLASMAGGPARRRLAWRWPGATVRACEAAIENDPRFRLVGGRANAGLDRFFLAASGPTLVSVVDGAVAETAAADAKGGVVVVVVDDTTAETPRGEAAQKKASGGRKNNNKGKKESAAAAAAGLEDQFLRLDSLLLNAAADWDGGDDALSAVAAELSHRISLMGGGKPPPIKERGASGGASGGGDRVLAEAQR